MTVVSVNDFIRTIYDFCSRLLFYKEHRRLIATFYRSSSHFINESYQSYVYDNSEKNMNQFNPQDKAQNEALSVHTDLQTQQVIDLQMSMAHLEMTVERLDEVIARQDKDIQTLQRQLQLIYKQVESQDPEGGIAPFDVMAERPPHY